MRKRALAIVFAVGVSQAVALSQAPPPQTTASPSMTPARIRDWANRLRSNDARIRATAKAALVQGGRGSLP